MIILDVLVQRCRDVDDVVRTEAVLAIAGAYKKDLNVMDSILTDCLKDRTLDKKVLQNANEIISLSIFLIQTTLVQSETRGSHKRGRSLP